MSLRRCADLFPFKPRPCITQADQHSFYQTPHNAETIIYEDVMLLLDPLRRIRLPTRRELTTSEHAAQRLLHSVYPRTPTLRAGAKYKNMMPQAGDDMRSTTPRLEGGGPNSASAERGGGVDLTSLTPRTGSHTAAARPPPGVIGRTSILAVGQVIVVRAPTSPWYGKCFSCTKKRRGQLLECSKCERSHCRECSGLSILAAWNDVKFPPFQNDPHRRNHANFPLSTRCC